MESCVAQQPVSGPFRHVIRPLSLRKETTGPLDAQIASDSKSQRFESPRRSWKSGHQQHLGPENQDSQHMLNQPRGRVGHLGCERVAKWNCGSCCSGLYRLWWLSILFEKRGAEVGHLPGGFECECHQMASSKIMQTWRKSGCGRRA